MIDDGRYTHNAPRNAEWLKPKAGIDYYVEADAHHYGVPHQLAGQHILSITAATIECFFEG